MLNKHYSLGRAKLCDKANIAKNKAACPTIMVRQTAHIDRVNWLYGKL